MSTDEMQEFRLVRVKSLNRFLNGLYETEGIALLLILSSLGIQMKDLVTYSTFESDEKGRTGTRVYCYPSQAVMDADDDVWTGTSYFYYGCEEESEPPDAWDYDPTGGDGPDD